MYFQLSEELIFPRPEFASPEGILAIGGDLSPKRLLIAYANGIFPWFSENEPIIWWSPDPRFVLYPDDLKVSKSMRPVFNQKKFKITIDTDFRSVIEQCGKKVRKDQDGTWIVPKMIDAYCVMHQLGLAHSVEAWQDGKLVGGLYGLSIGKIFFGESMFTHVSNASKAAFITLVRLLKERGFQLIDSQIHTPHLESLGGVEIPREQYLQELEALVKLPTIQGSWSDWL